MSSVSSFPAVVDLARSLIAIPSVNPALSECPEESGEHRLADFIDNLLREKGFRITRHERHAGRPSLVASYGPANPRRRFMIEAHLDTQGVHGMTVPPFQGLIREGRLYGRGACDMKGAMAAALVSLTSERLKKLASAGIEVMFAAAMGEETGNLGALELVDAGIGADELLVLEPTDLHVVHAHKGVLWLEIEVRGRAAHGSSPCVGVNAIEGVAPVIELLHRQVMKHKDHHPLLGLPTVNIGLVRGGTSINIVPEACVMQVDRRMLPGESKERILADIQAGLDELSRQGAFVSAEARVIQSGSPFETTEKSGLVRRVGLALKAAGVTVINEGAAWYSDAGPFSKTCREVAVFGPGSIAQAHTADEYIEISELERGAEVIGRFLDLLAEET